MDSTHIEKTSFFSELLRFLDCHDDVATRICSNNTERKASGYSELSGAFHDIYTLADTKLSMMFGPWWLVWLTPFRVAIWCVTWLPLGAWCYWRTLPLSNKMVRLIGYRGMSADMCNTRQKILFSHGKYDEATRCAHVGLRKIPTKAHERGLLYIGLAKLYKRSDDYDSARTEVGMAMCEAEEVEIENPIQAAQIYSHCAQLANLLGDSLIGSRFKYKAQSLLEAVKDPTPGS